MRKFKVGFLGGDSHAGTIHDMFQDSLPNHPQIESVDWQWVGARWGQPSKLPCVGKGYIFDHIHEYDLIFQNPYELNENDNPGLIELWDKLNIWPKVILYDIADDSTWHYEELRKKCLLYLKRAWEPHLFPKNPLDNARVIDFPLFQHYLDVVPMDFYPKRDMGVTCTLAQVRGKNTPRSIVWNAVKDADWEPANDWITQLTLFYSSGWTLSSAATSYREQLVPAAPGIQWWYVYMHMLRRTKVLFGARNHTATGDHRTWESFASGALYVTDSIPVPNPNNPEPWKHYIPFNLQNPQETIKVVKELLKDDVERERIAKAGLEHAIKYHHSDARVAYVMEEINKQLAR